MRQAHWVWALVVLGCGATAREVSPVSRRGEPPPVAMEPAIEPALEAEVAEDTPDDSELPAGPPTLTVSAPADLASAIAARLPTIEIVPESCGPMHATVAYTGERVCLGDPLSGRTRAMRRFSTSNYSTVVADRWRDEVVLAVLDGVETTTRYDGRIWVWDLRTDVYRSIAGLGAEESVAGATATPFGVVLRTDEHAWVYDGTLTTIRAADLVGPSRILVVGETAYDIRTEDEHRVVSALRREGGRVHRETVLRYEGDGQLEYRFDLGGEAIRSDGLIAWVRWARGRATLTTLALPSTETHAITLDVRTAPRRAFWVGEELRVSTFVRGGGTLESVVDLATGALTPATPRPEEISISPRSIHEIVPVDDGVVLSVGDTAWALSADGIRARARVTAPPPSSCRCDQATLRCGATEIPMGCTEVAELDAIDGDASTVYHGDGRLRIDRLEPDYVRITRLSDGARLWVRIVGSTVIAQADDGAFTTSAALASEGLSVRYGRGLLDAPISAFAPVRERLERPSLVADFFGDRPLPLADRTLP